MKLYSVGRSPFAARVRCVIYRKGLDVELAPPPASGLKGDEYLAINPFGRLPTLVLDDGRTIPESEVIVEHLEQTHPEPPVMPREPVARAQARLVARAAELYVLGPLFELFGQLDPATRSDAAVEAAFSRAMLGAGHLERLLPATGLAAGEAPNVADFMATPAWFWVEELHRMFGRTPAMDDLPVTGRYLDAARADALMGRIWREMADDLAALRAARR